MNEKDTGSFYTPQSLVDYMVSYVSTRVQPTSILEPSAGDGRFVNALSAFNSHITLVESEKEKTDILEIKFGDNCYVYNSDFIAFSLNNTETYDLIIGNPPYIPKKNIVKEQVEASQKLIEFFNLDKELFQNLWVSFVLASIKALSEYGAIFFVLPFEFLQVQYAEKLRKFLEERFNTIEIITFEDKVFEDIEQDICLVYMTNEARAKPYIQYTTLTNPKKPDQLFQSKIMRNKPLKKWSNCILNDEETEKLKDLASKFPHIKSFGDISPGIVTGANSFFILTKTDLGKLDVPSENVIPVISKSSFIPRLLVLKETDFDAVCGDRNRTHMLLLKDLEHSAFSENLKQYITSGEDKKINERYKCSKRNRWYDVPIIKKGDVCFFKRYDSIPRVIINRASIHTTDIIYNIRFAPQYDPSSFAFCFYNSLTLALCEYNGRFYGGGVEELVPSEFKGLPIPYKLISKEAIDKLDNMLRDKKTGVDKAVDYVDSLVLSELTPDEKIFLQDVRKRYLERRLKNA